MAVTWTLELTDKGGGHARVRAVRLAGAARRERKPISNW